MPSRFAHRGIRTESTNGATAPVDGKLALAILATWMATIAAILCAHLSTAARPCLIGVAGMISPSTPPWNAYAGAAQERGNRAKKKTPQQAGRERGRRRRESLPGC